MLLLKRTQQNKNIPFILIQDSQTKGGNPSCINVPSCFYCRLKGITVKNESKLGE